MSDKRVWRRMLLAAAVSGAVHAAAIALGPLRLPLAPDDLPPLEVRVVSAPPAVAPPPPATPHRVAPSMRRTPTRSAAIAPAVPVPPAPVADTDQPIEEAAPTAETVVVEKTVPQEEPVVVATAPTSTVTFDTPALPAFPRTGRITYDLVYGSQQFPVGRTVQSWKIEGTRYQLASRSETTGLADLLRSQHRTYLSQGELTPDGLRPERFLMSRDRGRGLEEGRAQFHWDRGTVTLGDAGREREQALPRGSFDLVSFIYQLAIRPPEPGRRQVPITNGRALDTYIVDVLPEERIETPLGVMRAIPVTQVREPGRESVDVWLAADYRHLPVRIRFYSRNGEPAGEQIVTEIRLGED